MTLSPTELSTIPSGCMSPPRGERQPFPTTTAMAISTATNIPGPVPVRKRRHSSFVPPRRKSIVHTIMDSEEALMLKVWTFTSLSRMVTAVAKALRRWIFSSPNSNEG